MTASTDRAGLVSVALARGGFRLNVDFDLPATGVLGVFGPSGSGKTSLLRCIAGLEPGACGEIQVGDQCWLDNNGQVVPPHRRRVGYVFQDSRLFPHLTVLENLHYGARRRMGHVDATRQQEVVALLGIESLLQRRPAQLSGGEQQRVAIARALLSDPALLLLDEPLASLDEARKQEVLPYLDRLHHQVRIPMIYVSHSVREVQRLCDDVLVLQAGRKVYQGDLLGAFSQADTGLSADPEVGVLLRGDVTGHDDATGVSSVVLADRQTLQIPARLAVGARVAVRVLARDVSLCLDPPSRTTVLNVLRGRITECLNETAHHVMLAVSVSEQTMLVRVSRKSWHSLELATGLDVYVQFKAVSIDDGVYLA